MTITKLNLLLYLRDLFHFELSQHATDYMLTASKPGHEHHFNENRQKIAIMDELITVIEGEAA